MLSITNPQETRFYQEAKEEGLAEGLVEGLAEGRTVEGRSLVFRLLNRRFNELPLSLVSQIEALSLPQLESLAKTLLDFQALADLETWLKTNAS